MKKTILIGNAVDDGQGDYLRRGGSKINDNFAELYDNLGDGERPFAAGAWKKWDTSKGTLSPVFGDAFTIDTTGGKVVVNLPKGDVAKYNHSIKLRDVYRSWSTQPVEIVPATGDTIKGSPTSQLLYKNFMDVELVYCSPGRWEYVENKRVDKITTSDLATVAKREYIATQGQTDFSDIFGINLYNTSNTEVYLRGNLLYYGDSLTADSNYGSIDKASADQVIPLDGKSIRLRAPCNAGDPVTIVTYMDGIASFRSTYNKHTIQVFQTGDTISETVPGDIFVGDLAVKKEFTKEDMGIPAIELINPTSLEIYINGRELMSGGTGELPSFVCEGAEGDEESICVANGGSWNPSGEDFSILFDDDGNVTGVVFKQPLDSGDFLTFKWFSNDIGTVMEWEGAGGIKEHTDKVYLNNEGDVLVENRIEYTDFNNPSQSTMRPVPGFEFGRILDIRAFFDLIHPIGTIYENANNPANPATYMGMGVWVRYAEGRLVAGWSSDAADSEFGLNNNDLDSSGNPTHTAGGTIGQRSVELTSQNIPELVSKNKVLVKDDNGPIIVGGCQLDPDASGPGYTKYREDFLKVNDGNVSPANINTLPPIITAYKWVRVA